MSQPDGYLVPTCISANDVVREVARGFLVTPEEILGPSREKRVTMARACAMACVREFTHMSFPAIGRLFDRDHTTVMHHVQKITSDPQLAEAVRLVVEELRSVPPRLFAVEAS